MNRQNANNECRVCGNLVPSDSAACPVCCTAQAGGQGQSFATTTPVAKRGMPSGPAVVAAKPYVPSPEDRSRALLALKAPLRIDPKVAIVLFSDQARIESSPTSVRNIGPLTLNPGGGTNYSAALKTALDLMGGFERVLLLVFGDGGANRGGGIFGTHEGAALALADRIKGLGGRIATIAFQGPTHNPQFLRAMASNPALHEETFSGEVQTSFVRATTMLTKHLRAADGKMLFIYVIDESGSMSEDNKKQEVEEAFLESLKALQSMSE